MKGKACEDTMYVGVAAVPPPAPGPAVCATNRVHHPAGGPAL